jgi:hypothetical protein
MEIIMEWEAPDHDAMKEMLASSFVNIQREIFINVSKNFFDNVEKTDKDIFKRANDFSKDFNDFDITASEEVTPENFSKFCDYIFDFMNYVRRMNKDLFSNSIEYAMKIMSFPHIPTLHMSILGCGSSIETFLNMREKILESGDEEDFE